MCVCAVCQAKQDEMSNVVFLRVLVCACSACLCCCLVAITSYDRPNLVVSFEEKKNEGYESFIAFAIDREAKAKDIDAEQTDRMDVDIDRKRKRRLKTGRS